MDNFNYTDNVTFNGNDGLNIDYTANLNQVGDYYEISFNVINDSKVDMEITNCDYHKNDEFINYELTYDNGKKVQQGDILKQGESKKIKYRVQYKKLIVENNYQVDTSFSINYEQIRDILIICAFSKSLNNIEEMIEKRNKKLEKTKAVPEISL